MQLEKQLDTLAAVGEIETCKSDIRGLRDALALVPHWRPAASLGRQLAEAQEMVDALKARMDRKLVVTLIGPSGAGKSTLLNALAGVDNLSPAGGRRPTTRGLVILCSETGDADAMISAMGQAHVQVRANQYAAGLDQLLLIDTPDTDSTQQAAHIPLIHQAIGLSDVLICVFDAENPKRRDHTDFLTPYVQRFSGAALVVCLNKCDRLAEGELRDQILPDFTAYLAQAWQRETVAADTLCISARSHLSDPAWEPQAVPRHAWDQFDRLRQLLTETFSQAGYSVDRRLANARQLASFARDQVARQAGQDRAALEAALAQMDRLESEAVGAALTAMKRGSQTTAVQLGAGHVGVDLQLYQKLAQRWIGPVGWLVATWARLLSFGSGLAHLMRVGNPLRQLWGAVSAYHHHREARAAVADLRRETKGAEALLAYRQTLLAAWPQVAEGLLAGRFDDEVRSFESGLADPARAEEQLASAWTSALDGTLEGTAGRLSHPLLQLVCNLPAVGILAYVGWLTASRFFRGEILAGNFFLHALVTIAILLLLTFFLLQGVVRLTAGQQRLLTSAFDRLQSQTGWARILMAGPLADQVRQVLRLAEVAATPAEASDRQFGG
ncbi:MAG: 50S ribosome-binding GTPase [Desulfosarcinaceae bacterium]|nr:50S ribosome-binding GTPase [Desulfosarcinaceae bacterium]